jgi:hypothetical protein
MVYHVMAVTTAASEEEGMGHDFDGHETFKTLYLLNIFWEGKFGCSCGRYTGFDEGVSFACFSSWECEGG